jgi:hypothetical protein
MLLNDMHVRAIRSDREREIAERQRARALPPRIRRSVRRAVGRSMVSIGTRLASEPRPQLARSR